MGLLDNFLGSSIDDPKTQATMAAIQGLLGGRGALQGISGGLLAYGGSMQQAKQQQQAQQLQALQLQQHQEALKQAQMQRAAQERQQAFLQGLQSPQQQAVSGALAGGGGPTMANASKMPAVDPQQEMLFRAVQAGAMPLDSYINSMRKDDTPITVKEGEVLLDRRTKQPIYTAPGKEDDFIKSMRAAGIAQGSPEWNRNLQNWLTKQSTHQPPVNVSVSMDKGFGTTFADNAAKDLGASRDKARAAVSTINTLNNIDRLIDTGKIATGPTQPFQTFGMQLAQGLGVGGKDNAEKLANTRQLITNAANLSLDGAARMAGQGQITEVERALIKDAAGGGIDRMTPPEIKALTGALRKVNTGVISGHQSLLKNVGPEFQKFTPFYSVDTPKAAVIDFGSLK